MTNIYPDISFIDNKNAEQFTDTLIRAYEAITKRTLYPADPVRLFILWIADVLIQQRIQIDFSAKQNVPRFAQGSYLDSLAENFRDVYRLAPTPAKTTLRFTLSQKLTSTKVISSNTRVGVNNLFFITTTELLIPPNTISGDVLAVCSTAGTIGNGYVAGQINKLVDVFPYYEKVENITTSDGGTDVESDESLRERMRLSMETFSVAGAAGAYEYFVKSASKSIADAKISSPTPGVVDIRIITENGLPQQELINTVQQTLSADEVRPLTDNITVQAPDTVDFSIDLTYYIPTPQIASASTISNKVTDSVNNYIKWQTSKIGRDIVPSKLVSLLMETGVKRVVVRNPTYTPISDTSIANLSGSPSIVNGGAEDE